jgi:hypothetical protein
MGRPAVAALSFLGNRRYEARGQGNRGMAECGVAADTKVETPEGALTIKGLAGKAVAVFTRDGEGRVRFRMMFDIGKVAEQQPVVKITLENGMSFRVVPEQVLFKKGMVETTAAAVRAGDALLPAFHFPDGYRFLDDGTGADRASAASLRVTAVEPGGTADIYAFGVEKTGCFFVSAGVLCKAAGARRPPPA